MTCARRRPPRHRAARALTRTAVTTCVTALRCTAVRFGFCGGVRCESPSGAVFCLPRTPPHAGSLGSVVRRVCVSVRARACVCVCVCVCVRGRACVRDCTGSMAVWYQSSGPDAPAGNRHSAKLCRPSGKRWADHNFHPHPHPSGVGARRRDMLALILYARSAMRHRELRRCCEVQPQYTNQLVQFSTIQQSERSDYCTTDRRARVCFRLARACERSSG